MHEETKKGKSRRAIKSIIGAASGNLVEWFDFYIYAVFVAYFRDALIPSDLDAGAKSIYVWGIFAASFFTRPLGSWLFGYIGDKYGRKKSMIMSIILMSFSSFLFALLPTYESVGVMAPLLLLFVRLLQGLSVGGEYGAVATYMSEVALKGRKGFFSSFQYVTLSGGHLLASLMGVIMISFMSAQQLYDGGWRIPFAIGGVVALLSLFLRSHLHETSSVASRDSKDSGNIISLIRKHTRAFFTVIGFTSAGSLSFYTITVYSRTYISQGLDTQAVGLVTTACLFVFMIVQPIFGALGDRWGNRKSMIYFSIFTALLIYPVMGIGMKTYGDNPYIIFVLLSIMMITLSFYTAIGGIVKAEMFPKEVRVLGVGVSYAIGNAIFGGTAPAMALKFKDINQENLFFIYVIVMLVICLFVSMTMPKEPQHLHDEEH